MKTKTLLTSISAGLLALSFATASDAALVSRLGGLAYYDTDADLTWLADASAVQTSGYDADGDGRMPWQEANVWVEQLTVGGVSGWRLPESIDVDNDGTTYVNGNFYTGFDGGYNVAVHSELSNLYYNVLGNLAYYDTNGNSEQPGWGLQNTGPFSNVQLGYYWSSEYATNTNSAWNFLMQSGYQSHTNKTNWSVYVWAVHSGDVSAVPVPAAMWLFGSGLLGLVGVARRRRANP